MEYLFTIFAIVYIVYGLPYPPPPVAGFGVAKLIIGLTGIVLLILVLFGMIAPPHRLAP